MISNCFGLVRKRSAISAFFVIGLVILCFSCEQSSPSFSVAISPTAHQSVFSSSGLNSFVYVPDGYVTAAESTPLIIYLHGYGETGLSHDGLPALIESGTSYPFIIISPQSSILWKNPDVMECLYAHLSAFCDIYLVNRKRIYLTGFSMGGDGVWAFAGAHPELFAAIAPVGSFGYSGSADVFAGIPVWIFHGSADVVVSPSYSQNMYNQLIQFSPDVTLTLIPSASHQQSKEITYRNQALYDWFLSHQRNTPATFSDCK